MRIRFNTVLYFIIIFSLFSIGSAFAKTSIAVFPILSAQNNKNVSSRLEELIRINLLNSREFSLIYESDIIERINNNNDLIPNKLDRNNSIIIGKNINTDYILWGEVENVDTELSYLIELINPLTEETIYAGEGIITQEDIKLIAEEIAESIIRIGKISSKITLNEIKVLSDIGKLVEAEKLLKRYEERNEKTIESDNLKKIIYSGLSKQYYDESVKFLDLFLFDESYLSINKAIFYSPDNKMYSSFADEIKIEENNFKNTEEKKILQSIENLIDNEHYEGAEILLNALLNRGNISNETKLLNEKIRKGKREMEYWSTARAALWNNNFTKARTSILEAVRINPKEKKYQEFIQLLDEEEAYYNRNREIWEKYRANIKTIDKTELFVNKKNVDNLYTAGFGFNTYEFRPVADPENNEDISYNSIDISYMQNWIVNPDLGLSFNLDFTDLYLTAYGGTCFGWGGEESFSGEDHLNQSKLFKWDLYVGGGPTFTIFSYFFGAGLELVNGVFHQKEITRNIATRDEETLGNKWSYHYGLGYSLWTGWNISDISSIIIRYRNTTSLYKVCGDDNREKHRFGSLIIAFGYGGFNFP